MEKQHVLTVLKQLRTSLKKRNFSQTLDIIFNLQGIDIKKPDQKLDFYFNLPHAKGKKTNICALVDAALASQTRKIFDTTISKEEFPKWTNKTKEQKKLAEEHDYFLAQADLMTSIAATFGKVLGPKGKMPNPKAGCVIPTTAPLEPLATRLSTLARIQTKNDLTIKLPLGTEAMTDEQLCDNILAAYNTLLTKLPQEKNNIRNSLIKFTMSQPLSLEAAKKTEAKK